MSGTIERVKMGKDSLPKGARMGLHDERGCGEERADGVESAAAVRLDMDRRRGHEVMASDAMRTLPRRFTEAYLVLHELGLRSLGSALGDVSDAPKQQISDTFVVSNGGLKDEMAIQYRKIVNRQLRLMAREITGWLEGTREARASMVVGGSTRCYQCNKFIERNWNNCAWCGRGTERTVAEGGK